MAKRFMAAGCVVAVASFVGGVVSADHHGWGSAPGEYYHWARSVVTTPIPLTIVNSTTDDWDQIVG